MLALSDNFSNKNLVWLTVFLAVIGGILAATTDQIFWLGLPAGGLFGWVAVVDFRKIFYLLMGCIPFSTEVELPGGFGTDLPTEPMIVVLMGIGILVLLKNFRTISGDFLRHPISIFILFHFAWILLTAFFSDNYFVSFKYLLAKIWYLAVFYFMAGYLIKNEKDLREMIFWMLPGLFLTIGWCTIQHAFYGFEFRHVNKAMYPFYRNKVMYSCLLAVVFPFVWLMARATERRSLSFKWLAIVVILCLIGIQLSYTRAAYFVIFSSYFLYILLKKRKIALTLFIATVFCGLLISAMVFNNRYLDFAPEYTKTVEHKKFNNLLEATYKLQDVSTMERVFRWVAGFRMLRENPIFGFGPGTFTFFYEKYTVTSFTTYVSDNEERSGIHCYFLMTAVEQGLLGGLIFVFLCGFVMLRGEKIYHKLKSEGHRRMLLQAWLCFVIIALLMLMNDLVETDKVGSFFWICCAILVNCDLQANAEKD